MLIRSSVRSLFLVMFLLLSQLLLFFSPFAGGPTPSMVVLAATLSLTLHSTPSAPVFYPGTLSSSAAPPPFLFVPSFVAPDSFRGMRLRRFLLRFQGLCGLNLDACSLSAVCGCSLCSSFFSCLLVLVREGPPGPFSDTDSRLVSFLLQVVPPFSPFLQLGLCQPGCVRFGAFCSRFLFAFLSFCEAAHSFFPSFHFGLFVPAAVALEDSLLSRSATVSQFLWVLSGLLGLCGFSLLLQRLLPCSSHWSLIFIEPCLQASLCAFPFFRVPSSTCLGFGCRFFLPSAVSFCRALPLCFPCSYSSFSGFFCACLWSVSGLLRNCALLCTSLYRLGSSSMLPLFPFGLWVLFCLGRISGPSVTRSAL